MSPRKFAEKTLHESLLRKFAEKTLNLFYFFSAKFRVSRKGCFAAKREKRAFSWADLYMYVGGVFSYLSFMIAVDLMSTWIEHSQ